MNDLKIVCNSTDFINKDLWNSYIKNFNEVFNKNFDKRFFINKYKTFFPISYHSFLVENKKSVVAALSVIPSKYFFENNEKTVGLVVDLFVMPGYRKDPLIILKLYLEIKKLLIKKNINLVVAVPNTNSYKYFKGILKFELIGNLNYYIHPKNIGNIKFNKNILMNFLSRFIFSINNYISSFFLSFINFAERKKSIRLILNDKIINKRFGNDYKKIVNDNSKFIYRISNEEGVKTCFLMYAKKSNISSARLINKAIKIILQKEDVDTIIYVGLFNLFQISLIKVPKFLEPRTLPLIFQNINCNEKEIIIARNINNWDFSLINYDVR